LIEERKRQWLHTCNRWGCSFVRLPQRPMVQKNINGPISLDEDKVMDHKKQMKRMVNVDG
jgi:hypothetical protein